MDFYLIGALIFLLVFQQWFFLRQIQILVNKLMSRSYHEFKAAEAPPQPRIIQEDHDVPEDLRVMEQFGM